MPAITGTTARLATAGLLLLAAFPASARWTGKGEAGVALSSGNSDARTANARVAATHKEEGVEYSFGLAGLYVRNDGDTTARRWEAMAQTRHDFWKNNFWYGGLRYEEDPFSGFDHQGLVTTGAGRRFIDTERTRLLLQIGAGFKFLEPLTPTDQVSDNEFTGVANVEFRHELTNTTTIVNRFGGEFTSGNNFLQNEVGLTVKMTDRIALSLAYVVRHNTDPPADFKRTDTLTTVNLVYEVK